jgi:hypothetical protein
MKRVLFCLSAVLMIAACNNEKKEGDKEVKAATSDATTPVDLPFKATYSSSFTQDVSDADLKMVLMTYKNWSDNNMSDLSKEMADSVTVDFSDGTRFSGKNADIMKRWTTFRDSLSSAVVEMEGWTKLYATDKKEGYVVTWYKEIDSYKTGKVDSAWYHDINRVQDGRISYFRQYKRAAK